MSFTLLTGEEVGPQAGPSQALSQTQQTAGGPQQVSNPQAVEELNFLNQGSTSESGFISQTAAGVASGLLGDPIIRKGVELVFGEDTATQLQSQFERVVGDSTSGSIARFVGEVAPMLLGTFGAYSVAARLGVRTAGRVGARGLLGEGATNIAARNAPGAGAALLENPLAQGLVERGAQAIGGSGGIALFEGARELADGKNPTDAGRAAAVAFGLGLTFDWALIAAGRGIGAANGRVAEVYAEKAFRPLLEKRGKAAADKGVLQRIEELTERTEKLQHSRQQEADLAKAGLEKLGTELAAAPSLPGFSVGSGVGKNFTEDAVTAAKRFAKAEQRLKNFMGKTLPESQKKLKRLEQDRKIMQDWLDTPGSYMSTRKTPFSPEKLALFRSQTGLKFFTTAEGLRGKLGGVASRMGFKPLAEADMETVLSHAAVDQKMMRWVDRTMKNTGITQKQMKKDPRAFTNLWHAWETGSDDGVGQFMKAAGRNDQQILDQQNLFNEMRVAMEDVAKPLAEMGAEPLLTFQEMAELGVKEFSPHVLLPKGREEARAALVKGFGELKGNQMFVDFEKRGLSKFGSFDWNRTRAGSLRDKLDDEALGAIYESNPFMAMRDYLHKGHYRLAYGKRFGLDGKLADDVVKAVRDDVDHGAGTLMANIFDQVMGRQYVEESLRQLSQTATSYQVATKLGMGVYPNMSQSANTIAFGGFRKTARAFAANIRSSGKDDIAAAVGIMHGQQVAMGQVGARLNVGAGARTAGGLGRTADMMENFADVTLRKTGFSLVEANNRTISGFTGKYVFGDNLAKLAQGRLRGKNFDAALRQMDSLGISPSETRDLVRGIKEGGEAFTSGQFYKELEARAVYRAAQLTQFTPGSLRRPEFWTHPVGRVVFQFKSFALNQGRFMKDQILAEAAAGNMKPLAYVLSIYPVAGEFVGDIKSIVKGRDREESGIERVVSNFGQMGGFGLMMNTWTAAGRRGGLVQDVAGPTFGGMAEAAEHLVQLEPQKILTDLLNDPTAQQVKAATLVSGAAAFKAHETIAPIARTQGEALLDMIRQKGEQRRSERAAQ